MWATIIRAFVKSWSQHLGRLSNLVENWADQEFPTRKLRTQRMKHPRSSRNTFGNKIIITINVAAVIVWRFTPSSYMQICFNRRSYEVTA